MRRLAGLLVIGLLVLVGCTAVDVYNTSESSVRVLIQLPDQPAGVTRLVESGSSVSTFSTSGGVVTVRVVPDERYRQALLSLREEITRRLFEERETLSPGDLARLVGNLADVQDLIDDLAVPGASCSINASDFAAVRVFASLDQSEWVLTCTVEEA